MKFRLDLGEIEIPKEYEGKWLKYSMSLRVTGDKVMFDNPMLTHDMARYWDLAAASLANPKAKIKLRRKI